MRITPFYFLLLLSTLCFWMSGNAQSLEDSIDHWVDELSVKRDLRSEKLFGVVSDLRKLNPAACCQVLKVLQGKVASENKRYRIRVLNLEAWMSASNYSQRDGAKSDTE